MEKLIAGLSEVNEAVVLTNEYGKIVYVNASFERVTGYTREEVMGKNPSVLNSGRQELEFYKNMWDTLAGGSVWVGNLINKRKDGTLFEEKVMIHPLHDPSGKMQYFLSVKQLVRDVVESASP